MSVIDSVIASLPFFQSTFPEDTYLAVGDLDVILAVLPGQSIDLKVPVGIKIAELEGTVTETCMKSRRMQRDERGPEMFGIPYVATATPIKDADGRMVGILTAVSSSERYDTLRASAESLAGMVEEMTAATDEAASASKDIASKAHGASEWAEQVRAHAGDIEEVLRFIEGVATQSHMLGINASIESARAGEYGKGFAVVANEIQKLAEQSKKSTKDVGETLNIILHSSKEMLQAAQAILRDANHHEGALSELKMAFGHISQTADEMLALSKTK